MTWTLLDDNSQVNIMIPRLPVSAAAIASLLLVGIHAPDCRAVIRFTGVNLSGAEFGAVPTPGNLGTYGTSYTYPTANEVTYYMGKGMNIFRLPFRWERMQPTQFATLDATELSRMDAFVNFATGQGANVIVEPHNFQRYYPDPNNFQQSAQGLVGSAVPDAALVDFWTQMADHYKNNGRVIFNLMNEPTTLPTEQLVTTTNLVIAGIRGTGATNIIHVPGNAYTGAHAWTQNWYGTPNAIAMLNVVDPAKNIVFEAHQYFDFNSSGTASSNSSDPQIGSSGNPNNTNIGVERLTGFTNWLKDNDLRGFLGEFALPNDRFGSGSKTTGNTVNRTRISDETLQATLNYINANDDVWEGWAWWGGGPWWNSGSYMFGLGPSNNNYVNPTVAQEAAALPYLVPYVAPHFVAPAGDFNQDDVVNHDDLLLWRMSFGRTGLDLAADGDNDGDVDANDFLVWQRTLGGTTPAVPGASAVPEPAAVVQAVLSLTYVIMRRQRMAAAWRRAV
jgi:aryl-phospho-beta-D-glucosidase BglC (GH1 family)